jgi:hypothetical protein
MPWIVRPRASDGYQSTGLTWPYIHFYKGVVERFERRGVL